jgi:hypothetical protein
MFGFQIATDWPSAVCLMPTGRCAVPCPATYTASFPTNRLSANAKSARYASSGASPTSPERRQCADRRHPLPGAGAAPRRAHEYARLHQVALRGRVLRAIARPAAPPCLRSTPSTLWRVALANDARLRCQLIDSRDKRNFERYVASNDQDLIWVGEPEEMDRCLVAQSGTFVVPDLLAQAAGRHHPVLRTRPPDPENPPAAIDREEAMLSL